MTTPVIIPTIEILPLKKGFLRAAADATHVLIRLVAPTRPATETEAERAPLDLALVIDRSGSMSGTPLRAALDCAVQIVQGLRPSDRISIVTFDTVVDVIQPLAEVGETQDLVRRIRQISTGGSTALFDGWNEGAKQLAPFIKQNRIARVILLTDGQANHGVIDEKVICEHVTKAAGKGITTSTVGLGADFNESLLTKMATAGEGAANFGQTADDLAEAFEEQFAILSNAFLRQVSIKIQGGSDVQARLVGETLEGPNSQSRKLGTLPWGAALTAVVELKIGANADGESLLAVNFSAVTKAGDTLAFGPALLALPLVALAEFSTLPADKNVAAAVGEALLAEQLETVEHHLQRGETEKAKLLLAELSKLTSLSPWAKEKVAFLSRLVESGDAMSSKELRYASRGMTRSIRGIDVNENSATFHVAIEREKALYIRKKMAAGQRSKPQQQPPQQPPQAPQAPQA